MPWQRKEQTCICSRLGREAQANRMRQEHRNGDLQKMQTLIAPLEMTTEQVQPVAVT